MRWPAVLVFLAVAGCLEAPPAATSLTDAAGSDGPAGGGPPVLLAAYRFDPASLLVDSSGNGHDGACPDASCPISVVDRAGDPGAAEFDGIDDAVVIEWFGGSGAFTVMAWFRLVALPEAGQFACPINMPFGTSQQNSWQVCLSSPAAGSLRVRFYTSDAPRELSMQVEAALATWHHVAIRWDGGKKSIVWDGADVVSAAAVTRFEESEIRFGSDLDGTDEVAPFSGALDDVEIWDGALPDEAIAVAAGL